MIAVLTQRQTFVYCITNPEKYKIKDLKYTFLTIVYPKGMVQETPKEKSFGEISLLDLNHTNIIQGVF